MTEYNEEQLKILEDLPEDSLVLLPETGEVFRRTEYGDASRYQWIKLVRHEKPFYMFCDQIAVAHHVVIWDPRTNYNALDEELFRLGDEFTARVIADRLAEEVITHID